MKNALTIDLEDYFHVSAYARKVRLEEWDSYPSRVAQNTDRLLELLSQHNCKATFRSEEHTSELQSHLNLVCRLLLEKKKAHLLLLVTLEISKPSCCLTGHRT